MTKETAQVPSSEGLIVGLETSLLFQVVPERAPEIRNRAHDRRYAYHDTYSWSWRRAFWLRAAWWR